MLNLKILFNVTSSVTLETYGFAVRLTPVIFLFLHHQPKKSVISKIEKKKCRLDLTKSFQNIFKSPAACEYWNLESLKAICAPYRKTFTIQIKDCCQESESIY